VQSLLKITILHQADFVRALGSTAVLACPTLLTDTPSLEKRRLCRGIFRFAKIAQTDTRKR
jgi:hypothetical protein